MIMARFCWLDTAEVTIATLIDRKPHFTIAYYGFIFS